MAERILRVFAVEGRLQPLIDPATGATLIGRFAGRDRSGAPMPDGELVPFHTDYIRALSRGDLTDQRPLALGEARAE